MTLVASRPKAMTRIARLRRVMSETALISMSRVPALTFLVWSTMSSTSMLTSRTPWSIIRLSMQRNEEEKPVIDRNGAVCVPCLTACVSSTVFFVRSSWLAQPARLPAMARARLRRFNIEGFRAFMVLRFLCWATCSLGR